MAKQTPPPIRLGVDFGNVIQGGGEPGEDDTTFVGATVADAVKSPPIIGALDGLRELVQRFGGRVWIVSKAGATRQRKTLAWLHHHDWWARTGMEPWSIAFVLHRKQKREVAERLGLTHFIGDRPDVLGHLVGVVPHLYLFGQTTADAPFVAMPDWSHVHVVATEA